MATMNLTESYMLEGQVYGPGDNIDVPLEGDALKALEEIEAERRKQLEDAARLAALQLPSGHPYHRLFPMETVQPPEFEGEPLQQRPPLSMFTPAEIEQLSEMLKQHESLKAAEGTVSAADTGEGAGKSPSDDKTNTEGNTTQTSSTPSTRRASGGTSDAS